MIRILIFLLLVIFAAGSITFLSGIDGIIDIRAFDTKYEMHTGAAIGIVSVLLLVLVFATSLFKDLVALPAKFRARKKEVKLERGMAALARGMESVMVGDAVDAQHHARIARRNLEQSSLTRLLTAQAAQLTGDDGAARENFTLMLEAPETEFLGLHGLYAHAKRAGDKVAARQHAERAFALRPNARWAYESVLDLGLERGAWGEARETLKTAKANRLITPEQAQRGEAALLTAGAYAAGLADDNETALKESEEAFRMTPQLSPAAILAASALADNGKKSKAAKILEQSFSTSPHPAISKLYQEIFADETPEKQAKALNKLSGLAPDHHEGKFLAARAECLLGHDRNALELLEPLIANRPFAREFRAVAEAVEKLRDEEAARPWMERAAKAPRDPEPGANGNFNFTKIGWARLVREFMDHDRLSPPPLEDTSIVSALTHEEAKLLSAPTEPEADSNATERTDGVDHNQNLEETVDIDEAPNETAQSENDNRTDKKNPDAA